MNWGLQRMAMIKLKYSNMNNFSTIDDLTPNINIPAELKTLAQIKENNNNYKIVLIILAIVIAIKGAASVYNHFQTKKDENKFGF